MRLQALVPVLLFVTVALAGCNSDKDTDGDGLPDFLEKQGWDVLVYTMTESVVRHVTSDPEKVDTDGDGLSDFDEGFVRGGAGLPRLDPTNPDTDGDGLTDCQEWYIQVGDCPSLPGFRDYDFKNYVTDPVAMDSDFPSTSRYLAYHINDGRGYQDHEKLRSGTGAYKYGDGISDYDEIFGYTITRPDGSFSHGVRSSPSVMDTDGDGLEDGEEALVFGSEPGVPDTDGDGCLDGRDIFPTQADTYRVAFDRIKITDGPAAGGGANLFMVSSILALTPDDFRFHPAQGHVDAGQGETVSLQSINGGFAARNDCGDNADPAYQLASAVQPWILVQFSAIHKGSLAPHNNEEAFEEASHIEVMDVASTGLPAEARADGRVYWNPQEDVYRWSIPSEAWAWRLEDDAEVFRLPADGWFHRTGPAGELWFKPEVRLV